MAADLCLGRSLLTKLLFHHLLEASLFHRHTEYLHSDKILSTKPTTTTDTLLCRSVSVVSSMLSSGMNRVRPNTGLFLKTTKLLSKLATYTLGRDLKTDSAQSPVLLFLTTSLNSKHYALFRSSTKKQRGGEIDVTESG